LGRNHSAKKALYAIEQTALAGINNISIDLMYDLPDQTIASFERTLNQIEGLPITHLSLYNLTFEPHTAFFKRQKALAPLLPSPEASYAMLDLACARLPQMGLHRYEISAFAKEGFHSIHNSGYWTARPFLGFGPSAFSYFEGKRFRNVSHLNRYAKALQSGLSPIDFEEQLSYPDNLHELLAVELRLLKGVDLSRFEQRHAPLPATTKALLDELKQKGWLLQENGQIRLTAQGRLFYDSVASSII
jgi:oxygen-independent coproporphyrinogen-3 oxidase